MYADPTLIRDNAIKVSLNDLEDDLITAWVNYRGGQKATLIREWLLEQARMDLGLDAQQSEGQQLRLSSY